MSTTKFYINKIKGLNELVEDQAKEIKELKSKCKEMHKALKKRVEMCNDYHELVEDQAEEIKALKKHNNYYISQIKAIKTIAEKPLNLCDNLNDIIHICCDIENNKNGNK